MINPFAKRIQDKQLEMELVKEATGSGIPAMVAAALHAVSVDQTPRLGRQRMAPCGGLYRRDSIRQRTRLNRMGLRKLYK